MIDALRRFWQAMQQLGAGQEAALPVAGGDVMQQIDIMRTYWRAYLQERLLQDGAGYGADSTVMTDVDQFMMPDAEGDVPDATLADLGGLMDEAAPGAHPGTGDDDWLSYLDASGDDAELDDLDLPDGA
ncbi:MAG: hypothetical protein GY824_14965 [Delftia sp.]|nr:hypothetical protein [Delftia sp.]